MAPNDNARIALHVGPQQCCQRLLLFRGARILWLDVVLIHAADVANADVAGVVLANVRALLIVSQGPHRFSVQFDHPMIGGLAELGLIPFANHVGGDVTACRCGGAMHGQVFDLS